MLLERELFELERLNGEVCLGEPEVSQIEHQPRKSGRKRTKKRHFEQVD